MGRSRGFGSIPCNYTALFRLGFPTAPSLMRLNLAAKNNSRTHYAKGTLSHNKYAPTACRRTVSGSLSLPSPGFFSPFPHGTCSLSVIEEYLGLADGPAGFTPDVCVLCYSGYCSRGLGFRLQVFHLLWPCLPALSSNLIHHFLQSHNPSRNHFLRFGLFRFRSPLLTESLVCFLFLKVLRCFNSLRSLYQSY